MVMRFMFVIECTSFSSFMHQWCTRDIIAHLVVYFKGQICRKAHHYFVYFFVTIVFTKW